MIARWQAHASAGAVNGAATVANAADGGLTNSAAAAGGEIAHTVAGVGAAALGAAGDIGSGGGGESGSKGGSGNAATTTTEKKSSKSKNKGGGSGGGDGEAEVPKTILKAHLPQVASSNHFVCLPYARLDVLSGGSGCIGGSLSYCVAGFSWSTSICVMMLVGVCLRADVCLRVLFACLWWCGGVDACGVPAFDPAWRHRARDHSNRPRPRVRKEDLG